MATGTLLMLIAALAVAGFLLGRRRALASAGGDARTLHSLPRFYGLNVALAAILPAVAIIALWTLLAPVLTEARVTGAIDEAAYGGNEGRLSLLVSEANRIADEIVASGASVAGLEGAALQTALEEAGVRVRDGTDPSVLRAAQIRSASEASGALWMTALVLVAVAASVAVAYRATNAEYRARNAVERAVMVVLIFASTVAILTTVGIVLSMLFETVNFFQQYPAGEFFFSTTWDPSFSGRGGGSELGIIPLLWGTLYISFIALLVAVPIGLLAAIYMSEYASPKVRGVAKPLLEILAGIPTIVYGLFALITVGPLLRDYFAQPLGLGNSASSVMTAGLVMGIMLIPFVSSLSDDVINAVPQSMRDGSLGLGATHSETIRQVVVPAALPGIVGSILLAASRAIGETMIVVLGAGAAAKLDLNPFEAMTTVTVKIVSQLTGDTDFSSPETLVAFALGLTLFVMTLALNVLALWIVRRYREQYE